MDLPPEVSHNILVWITGSVSVFPNCLPATKIDLFCGCFCISFWTVPCLRELHLDPGTQAQPQLHRKLRVVKRRTSVLWTRTFRHHLLWGARRPGTHRQLRAWYGGVLGISFFFISSKLSFQRAPQWYMDCWDLHSRIVNWRRTNPALWTSYALW